MLAILFLVLSGLLIAVSAAACRGHRRVTAMAVGALSAFLLWQGAGALGWPFLVEAVVVLVAVEVGALVGAYGIQGPDDGAAA